MPNQRYTKCPLVLFIAAVLFGISGCGQSPPAVDTSLYAPLTLAPAALAGVRDARAEFRELFCREEEMTSASSEQCSSALRRFRGEADEVVPLEVKTDKRSRYRIAFVPGTAWDCLRGLVDETDLPTLHLEEFGYDTTIIPIQGLSSTPRNAEIIDTTLRALMGGDDKRPFILIGYSKGAPDALVALERYPDVLANTAAFVSIAGAIGGSPIAEHTSASTIAAIRYSPYGDCSSSRGDALESLRPARRHAWMADHLPLSIPAYSLVTTPEPERVSRALRSSYELLGALHPVNDGALLYWDQLLPGSTLLGYANADHWAVAIPVETDAIPLGDVLVTNGYPRTRLWLAIADFVVTDLEQRAEASKHDLE